MPQIIGNEMDEGYKKGENRQGLLPWGRKRNRTTLIIQGNEIEGVRFCRVKGLTEVRTYVKRWGGFLAD